MIEQKIIDDALPVLYQLTIDYTNSTDGINEVNKLKYEKLKNELKTHQYTCNVRQLPLNYNINNKQYYYFSIEEITINGEAIIRYKEELTKEEILYKLRNIKIDKLNSDD